MSEKDVTVTVGDKESVVVGDPSTRWGAATFRMTTLGEHDLLPQADWDSYLYMYGEFVFQFWEKWKKEYESKKGLPDEGLLEVMCDDFVEQGGQPVPPEFWLWLNWGRNLSTLKRIYPQEHMPREWLEMFPTLERVKK